MTLLWKRLLLLSIIGCLAAYAQNTLFHGPSWRAEPSDLILPIHSPNQEAVLTCEASGVPSPQYRSGILKNRVWQRNLHTSFIRARRPTGEASYIRLPNAQRFPRSRRGS
ncbi:hypothetical protein MHYP_G00337460 [Metynnis hypsauchen]